MKRLIPLLVLVVMLAGLLSSCAAPAATTAAPVQPTSAPATAKPVEPTKAPEPTRAPEPTAVPEPVKLILGTTTSTQDSGLLDVILPDFEKQFNVKVDVIAVGTGQAIQLGKDGNADVLLVHARAQEDAFMADKHGVRREDVMYNDFVIIGPESDPAGIKGMTVAADAFKKIAEAKSTFISRGDDSGTHTKEKAIWKAAGIEPAGDWYVSAGATMGEVLTMAQEKQVYTLTDRATYLARTREGLTLPVLVEGDKTLFNPYGVIAVNPDKGPQIKNDLANKFIDWLISVPTMTMVADYGKKDFGASLFYPSSKPWTDALAAAAPAAALKVTGLVEKEMSWADADLKAMETLTVQSKNKSGETSDYTGVLISKLLELAAPTADAKTVVFVADDGFTAEIALADVQACTDCIVSFRSQGGYSTVLPGKDNKLQVKGRC